MITIGVLFPDEFIKALLGLLLVIVLDLALGISVAIKQKKFDFKKLADFYTSSVIPIVLGWAVADVILRLAGTLDIPIITAIGNIGIAGFYLLAMGALLGNIAEKVTALKAPVPEPQTTVTVAVTLPTQSTPTPTAAVIPEKF